MMSAEIKKSKNLFFQDQIRIFGIGLFVTFLGTVITVNIALPLFLELLVGGDFSLQEAFDWNLFLIWESLKVFLLIVTPFTILACGFLINRVTQRFMWWQEHPKELQSLGMWTGISFALMTTIVIAVIWGIWAFFFLGLWIVLFVPYLWGAVWGSLMAEIVFRELQKS